MTRIDCDHKFRDDAPQPSFSCDIVYSDRMSEDGRHYKTVSLDADAAAAIYQTLKELFGVEVLGPEAVTGAQDVTCVKRAAGGSTSCKLNRLKQPGG